MIHKGPAELRSDAFNMRILEGEVAFSLAKGLPAQDVAIDRQTVIDAVACVHPAIEIADCRYIDNRTVGIHSLVADGTVTGAFVYGDGISDWRDIDLAEIGAVMSVDGVEVAVGQAPMCSAIQLCSRAMLEAMRSARHFLPSRALPP